MAKFEMFDEVKQDLLVKKTLEGKTIDCYEVPLIQTNDLLKLALDTSGIDLGKELLIFFIKRFFVRKTSFTKWYRFFQNS